MMDYALLQALVAVQQESSFEGAARSLGMTSSAVSQRIRQLEERIGAVLVHRNPTRPSPVGKLLCRHAEMVMLLEDELVGENSDCLKALNRDPFNIRISVNEDSLSSWFMDVLKPGNDNDYRFYFDIVLADQDHSIKEMKSGEVLAGISSSKEPAQGFRSYPLGQQIYRATASPSFVELYFPDGITQDSFKNAPSLRYSEKDELQKQWIEQIFGVNIELPFYTIPSTYGLIESCLNDVAWGMNPAMLVDHHIASGDIVELTPNQTLNKSLYWHVSRVVDGTLTQVTQKVRKAANAHLLQVASHPALVK